MGLLLFGTSLRAATNLIIKSDGVKSKAMQMLSTAVTTGLETIFILTIFLNRSEV